MDHCQDNKPLSVVIPVYNRGNLIRRTLDSVADQNTELFNLIVVDNNSGDDSVEVISQWIETHPGISVSLVSESYKSAAAARNRGLQEVATPWVMFFDSDDVMLPRHIESAVELLGKHKNADVVGWDVNMNLSDGSSRVMHFPSSSVLKNHLVHASLSTQRYMVRTELIRRVGGWNRTVRKWDDYELGVRILSASPVIVVRKGSPLVNVIFTKDSITGMDFSSGAGEWERALDEMQTTLEKFAPSMTDWIAWRRADLAAEYHKEGADSLVEPLLDYAQKEADRRWLVRLIYNVKKVLPRGSWRIADLFIR